MKLTKTECMTCTKVLAVIPTVIACIDNTTILPNLCLLHAIGRTSLMKHCNFPLENIPILVEFLLQLCYYIIIFVVLYNGFPSLKFFQTIHFRWIYLRWYCPQCQEWWNQSLVKLETQWLKDKKSALLVSFLLLHSYLNCYLWESAQHEHGKSKQKLHQIYYFHLARM